LDIKITLCSNQSQLYCSEVAFLILCEAPLKKAIPDIHCLLIADGFYEVRGWLGFKPLQDR